MLAAPTLIGRSTTSDLAGVSRKGNINNSRWQLNLNKREIYHHGLRPFPIIFHYPHPSYFSFYPLPLNIRIE
jgi:hypothetical protein